MLKPTAASQQAQQLSLGVCMRFKPHSHNIDLPPLHCGICYEVAGWAHNAIGVEASGDVLLMAAENGPSAQEAAGGIL